MRKCEGVRVVAAIGLSLACLAACRPSPAPPPVTVSAAQSIDDLASRVDPYVEKNRVIVLTDIANEPDDQMSMVRLLVYSNEFDIEGLVATTSTWMRERVRPDVIQKVVAAYGEVQPNLLRHAPGFPTAAALNATVTTGQTGFGMAAVGADKTSPGADLIIRAADSADPRPLWVLAWGGTNTLAQALSRARETRPAEALATLISKLRVYTISDQDDAGPWIRREFPRLHYIAMPTTPDGDEYYRATWTGISGDRFYKNADGADFTTFTDAWVNANIRSKGPLGRLYIMPCCIHEGDTPSFLGLINNGLAGFMTPAYGGWGGRYVWRRPSGEPHAFWTQGGDAYPGKDSSRDTVAGADGRPRTSDQATIWRWRTAFQHDFAARMDWTIKDLAHANHNPLVVVNGHPGKAPVTIDVDPGKAVTLDASGTSDPDRDRLVYRWIFYSEAGTGIPTHPVAAGPPVPIGGGGNVLEGGIPSAGAGGAPELPARLILSRTDGPLVTATLRTPGLAHVILAVEDQGAPSLTSYRRVILKSR